MKIKVERVGYGLAINILVTSLWIVQYEVVLFSHGADHGISFIDISIAACLWSSIEREGRSAFRDRVAICFFTNPSFGQVDVHDRVAVSVDSQIVCLVVGYY